MDYQYDKNYLLLTIVIIMSSTMIMAMIATVKTINYELSHFESYAQSWCISITIQ